ncbi:MAG: bifunctional glutamate N-acetyltransferase/amino-acid acetyltransferase ArgJ [Acidobacteria bacterium]|nr:bifunctional glutamate N-acetyltransferase/amino-acid acetyltransferase ArgJ [Acidobacteriota bacterium]
MKAPRGFALSGVRAGLRKQGNDLTLIHCEGGATGAAVFTRNLFQAAPVVLSRASLKAAKGRVSAVVINAGCATAITGKAGMDAARRVQSRAAELLDVPRNEVFVASTGVIGVVLPHEKLTKAMPLAVTRLSHGGLEAASRAILTTDAGPKVATATFRHGGRLGHVTGFAKGAGMIHPSMATMLAFVMTDAAAPPGVLKSALTKAVDASFNAISVDGDTSTNDTVLLLASGKLGNEPIADLEGDGASFLAAVTSVCRSLARMITRDGEGATRLLEITVKGAKNEREAKLAAHAIGTSPLVKTALHGGDPNWGRILAAVGRSGARFSPAKVSLSVGPLALVTNGAPTNYKETDAARLFAKEEVPILVDLAAGKGSAHLLTCDLGHDYVSLNVDYRS